MNRCLLAFLLGGALVSPLQVSLAEAQTMVSVEKLSKNALGVRGNDDSAFPALSANRAKIAFQSRASNLIAGDLNGSIDIFLKRGISDFVTRIRETPAGLGGNGRSSSPSLTPTGPGGLFAVLFESVASNLVRRSDLVDSNGVQDIFISVPTRNFVERVSVGPSLTESDGDSSDPSATLVSEPNRILVAYTSEATNLVGNDANGFADIFLATIVNPTDDGSFLETGLTTTRISTSSSGGDSNGPSSRPRISRDGQKIVFESQATDLVAGTPPTAQQVYLYDIASGETTLVSRAADGTPGDGVSGQAALNYGGTVVVYATRARNILSDGKSPVDGAVQIVRYDIRTGASTRINVAPDGSPGNGTTATGVSVDVDASGRFVAFSDWSSNLVSSDSNGVPDVFLSDIEAGTLRRVSESVLGAEGDAGSFSPVLARGSYNTEDLFVLFSSNASTLVSDDAGSSTDIFAARLSIPPRTLSRTTSIEVPPDTSLDDDRAFFTLESFSNTASVTTSEVAAATRRQTYYDIRIAREGRTGRAADNRRKLAKRNTTSFRRLKSGSYTAKYRVVVKRGDRVVSKTKFSPVQRFSKDDVESEA